VTRDICKPFGKRIRELRKERAWRQIDLAEEAGINERYVSDLEIGKKEVCLRTILLLADAFDISLAELFRGVKM